MSCSIAAGRRSARPNRGWMTVASLLAATAGALACAAVAARSPIAVWRGRGARHCAGRSDGYGECPQGAAISSGCGRSASDLAELEPENRPAGDLNLIESGPALRAFTRPRLSFIDWALETKIASVFQELFHAADSLLLRLARPACVTVPCRRDNLGLGDLDPAAAFRPHRRPSRRCDTSSCLSSRR